MMEAYTNPTFEGDDHQNGIKNGQIPVAFVESKVVEAPKADNQQVKRENWGNSIEFLFSCIAMSVGLGNIWRFPFAALKNGGGAFVIPYLIVLFLVGKPIYFMEMVIGQFSSRGTVKMYDFSPGLKGIGVSQVISTFIVSTYYASILATTLKYLLDSFSSVLPWAVCSAKWSDVVCRPSGVISSDGLEIVNQTGPKVSSAVLYFGREVIREKSSIDDGIGYPNWDLAIFLLVAWTIVFLIMIKGIRSSGKASYFLALFPYVVLLILLIRAVTLPGAMDGIAYFLTPDFEKMLDYRVWFDAVTQVLISLNICFGCISMYSSFNKFNHKIYRDSNIISITDTFTSLLAGCITFGILGHLKYKTGEDVFATTEGGPGLAFISYPDAIAKFEHVPQFFSVLFFLMLFTLGIGSIVAMLSCVMTAVRDNFTKVKHWHAALGGALIAFFLGIAYVTPGGLYMVTLVDFFGVQLVAYVFAIAELIAVFYVYGMNRFCKDIEFMLGFRPSIYWRACWKVIAPGFMIAIFIYTIINFQPIKYNDRYVYPTPAYILGWCITALCLVQLPIFAILAITKQKNETFIERLKSAFKPASDWGPKDPTIRQDYINFVESKN